LRLSLIHSNSTVFTRWGEQQTAWRRDAKPFYLYQRHGLAACGVFLGKRGERRGQRAALTIAGRAISSLIQTQGLGDWGIWVAWNGTSFTGGRAAVDGVESDNRQRGVSSADIPHPLSKALIFND
jgi:hypothetical protein